MDKINENDNKTTHIRVSRHLHDLLNTGAEKMGISIGELLEEMCRRCFSEDYDYEIIDYDK